MPLVTLEKLAELANYLQSDIAAFFQSIIADKRQKIEDLPEELEVFRGIAIRKKSLPDEENMSRLAEFPISKEEKSLINNKPCEWV